MRNRCLGTVLAAVLICGSAPAWASTTLQAAQPHITRVSGQQGDSIETARAARISEIHVRELNDRPCILYVAPYSASYTHADQCNNRMFSTGDGWRVTLPRSATVIGIQPCFNRRSGRLKGMRVFYDDGIDEGASAEIQPNCRGNRARWGRRLDCPDQHIASGIRAHYQEMPRNRANPIIGVQLMCRPSS